LVEAGMLTFDSFVDVGFLPEYLELIPDLKVVLSRRDKIASFTVAVVVKLTQYRKCCQVLAENGFRKYFAGLRKMVHYQKACDEFEENMKLHLQ
jgi:hypothetical protein